MSAQRLLEIARGELGVAEAPAGSNRVKYNTWYYGREVSGSSYPWCMAFVQWCCDRAGAGLPLRTASCGGLMRAAKMAGCWIKSTQELQPGDVAIYDFPGGAATDHCGIIESVDSSAVTAIEGNTSAAGSQSNGGMVCRKRRPIKQIVGAVRPVFGEEEDTDMTVEEVKRIAKEAAAEAIAEAFPTYRTLEDVPEWYAPAIKKLVDEGVLQGTGGGELNVNDLTCRDMTILDRKGKLD